MGPFCLVYLSSSQPIYTFAKLGTALVPIAVPLTCIKFWLLNVKSFNLSTFSSRQVRVLADGWICPVFSSSSSIMVSPSFVSIFVYKLGTSNVTRMQSFGTLPKFVSRMMKSVVSLMCDCSAPAKGHRNSSTYADNFSV